jgi:hypothetical protein
MHDNKPINWRDHLKVHPAAELFPLLSETDPAALKELAEDIRQHGQREPASYIKDSDGNRVLLDGRNRLDALEMLGRKIDVNDSSMFEQRSLSINAQAFIISKNIHRRHLTAEKKRDLIGLLLKANPEKSDRQIAKTVKASHHTVEAVRTKLESTGQIAQLNKTVGADGKARKRPAAKAKPQNDRLARLATEVLDLVAKGEDCLQKAESIRNSEAMPTAEEAEESYQETLYDQACLLLESMASETRQKFFGHVKENYQLHFDCDGAGVTPDDGLNIPDYLKRVAP